ncbi:hypothetical protein DNTS_020899 [Danionella cerebrum]|uniref:CAAX prenyl protease 2 n=1 Tax=Danionella cerebrum TaxID=2873325 RepID=A0A553MQ97_9TELE|nr:hypothetical protein DNTS_020899 [Danionella translucida]
MNEDLTSFHSEQEAANVSSVPDGLCWVSILSCLLLACSYVGSLYVWKNDLPRMLLEPGPSLMALMGIRLEGLIPAIILPLLLTMVLFLGPLIQLAMDYPCFWTLCLSDMRWLRNQVVAPLTEELVFRACMLPMLVPCAGPSTAIFTCPLFFGVAHFHHVIELLRFRQGTVSGIFLSAVFQFSYTAVFGAYTAFIFIRTGHLMGPVLCHSFCNYMGFPALSTALDHPHRYTILSFYIFGVILFLLLIFPMTDPIFYGFPTPVCTLTSTTGSICS